MIVPRRRWGAADAKELWRFRGLLGRFTIRDLTLRYRQTALGIAWVVIQPLAGAGVFTVVFGRVAGLESDDTPYYVFAFAGLLGWTAFSAGLTKSTSSLVGNGALVSKIYFPRMLLPLSTVGSTVIDLIIGLGVMAVLLWVSSTGVSLHVLALPALVLLTLALATGMGLVLSALAVRYRDVNYILPVAIQFLLYACPVGYSVDTVPSDIKVYFDLNPLTGLLEGFRWSLLGTDDFPSGALLYSAGAALVALVVGVAVFTRMERTFADVI